MMTEGQATTKWCPFVRIARREVVRQAGIGLEREELVGGCNTDALGTTRVPASCRCIGSDCMAWRWMEYSNGGFSDTRGYCGLAGRVIEERERA